MCNWNIRRRRRNLAEEIFEVIIHPNFTTEDRSKPQMQEAQGMCHTQTQRHPDTHPDVYYV